MRPWASGRIIEFILRKAFGLLPFTLLLLLASARAEQVRLAWDANTEADLAGYRIYHGRAPSDLSESTDVGLATTSVVDALVGGNDYYFAVTAYNSDGLESDRSELIHYRAPQAPSMRTFSGLIGENADAPQGAFTMNLSASGRATGRVLLNGKAYAWRGTFDQSGSLSVQILTRSGLPVLSLTLHLGSDAASVSGTAEASSGTAAVLAHAAPPRGKNLKAGRYTMVLAVDASADGMGYGFGVINVSKSGLARFAGTIPSGVRFTRGIKLDAADTAPLYVFQRASNRMLFGRVHFRDVPGETDADAVLSTTQIPGPGETITLKAARFNGLTGSSPQTKSPGAQSTLSVVLTRPGEAELSGQVTGRTKLIGAAASGEYLTLKVSLGTGIFSGACTAPGEPPFIFTGVLFRKTTQQGYGRGRSAFAAVELNEVP